MRWTKVDYDSLVLAYPRLVQTNDYTCTCMTLFSHQILWFCFRHYNF